MTYNQKIPPFKWFILENFPYIEEDFDALTNWQLFCKLGKEMNKIIEKCNLTGEQVERLTTAFNELKEYVDDYFENLDIQEEVNTKLDEMAESGELAELISQYLESQAIIGFNTCSSLSQATNLADGSFARTLGRNSYNDGFGAFYKIRTRINADVPDGYNIIELTNTQNLVAEKMIDSTIISIQNDISSINQTIQPLNKKYVFIGDSYADGWSPDGDYTGWTELLPTKMGLTSSQYNVYAHGGYRFDVSDSRNNYINLINNVSVDNNVTDVIVAGGYNDMNTSYSNLNNGIVAFKNKCLEKYPNAKLHLSFIGWTTNNANLSSLKSAILNYQKACDENNIHYIKGCETAMHNYFEFFSSDGIHPNQAGQTSIANALFNGILYNDGKVEMQKPIFFSFSHSGASTSIDWIVSIKNGFMNINSTKTAYINYTAGSYPTMTGSSLFEVGTINWGLIIGSDNDRIAIPIQMVINDSAKYRTINAELIIKSGKVYIKPNAITSSGASYETITVKSIEMFTFNSTFDSLNG